MMEFERLVWLTQSQPIECRENEKTLLSLSTTHAESQAVQIS